MISAIWARLQRRVRIEITCPHGTFVPASYAIGSKGHLGCPDCPLRVEVSWQRGEQR